MNFNKCDMCIASGMTLFSCRGVILAQLSSACVCCFHFEHANVDKLCLDCVALHLHEEYM